MKKIILAFVFVFGLGWQGHAQSIADALQQLAIDYQKLAGMKSILQQMYQGYEVVSKGYNSVKNISQGNYSLHQAFLDGLMLVSPAVRKYPRIQEIIDDQLSLVDEYKSAYGTFSKDLHFSPDEIAYMLDVYNNLIAKSADNMAELTMVISDNQLRMSDDERLRTIDRIYATGHDQLTFLKNFDDKTRNLAVARAENASDRQTLKQLYGIQ